MHMRSGLLLLIFSMVFASSHLYAIDPATLTKVLNGYLEREELRGCLLNPEEGDRGVANAFAVKNGKHADVYLLRFDLQASCTFGSIGKCTPYSSNQPLDYAQLCVSNGLVMQALGEERRYLVPDAATLPANSLHTEIITSARKLEADDSEVRRDRDWVQFLKNADSEEFFAANLYDAGFTSKLELEVTTERILNAFIDPGLATANTNNLKLDQLAAIGVGGSVLSRQKQFIKPGTNSVWYLVDEKSFKDRLTKANQFLSIESLNNTSFSDLYSETVANLLDPAVIGEQRKNASIKQRAEILLAK